MYTVIAQFLFASLHYSACVSEYLVCEQVCLAALDCNRRDVAYLCAMDLVNAFPNSLRVRKLQALELDAEEK